MPVNYVSELWDNIPTKRRANLSWKRAMCARITYVVSYNMVWYCLTTPRFTSCKLSIGACICLPSKCLVYMHVMTQCMFDKEYILHVTSCSCHMCDDQVHASQRVRDYYITCIPYCHRGCMGHTQIMHHNDCMSKLKLYDTWEKSKIRIHVSK
jgi:hypothetical protein